MEKIQEKIAECLSAGMDLGLSTRASKDQITQLEVALGVILPESYKWFLSNYGGGGANEKWVFGIIENDYSTQVGGSVLFETLTAREEFGLAPNLVIIGSSDGVFYDAISVNNENPDKSEIVLVTAYNALVDGKIADDFESYLLQLIELWMI